MANAIKAMAIPITAKMRLWRALVIFAGSPCAVTNSKADMTIKMTETAVKIAKVQLVTSSMSPSIPFPSIGIPVVGSRYASGGRLWLEASANAKPENVKVRIRMRKRYFFFM